MPAIPFTRGSIAVAILIQSLAVIAAAQQSASPPDNALRRTTAASANRNPTRRPSTEGGDATEAKSPTILDPARMPQGALSLDDVGKGFRDSKKSDSAVGSGSGEEKSPLSLTEEAPAGAEDKMEDIQSFNTYTSLEDGQPGQRGELQINYFNGWETQSHRSDPWNMLMEIEYSPNVKGNWLLENAKFGIDVPMELGNGGVDGNGDIALVWKQRLLAEKDCNWWPTISLENELRLPTGYHSSGVDYTLEGVVAKNVGPGTAVFNAWFESANGHNNLEQASWWDRVRGDADDDELRHFQWGFRAGYKWRLTDCFALIADYVNQSSELEGEHNQNIGEFSAEWRITNHLTVGPGIMFGLDGQETTPNFGAGVLVHYSIGD